MKNANVNYFVSMNHVYHMFHVPYIFVLTTAGPPLTDDKCIYAFAKICPKGVTNLCVSVSVAADEVPRVLDSGGWDPPALFATCGRSRILHDVTVCEILG